MTRYQSVIIYGILIVLNGIILMALSYNTSRAIQYSVGIGMILAAIFAIISSRKSKDYQIPMKYHAIHAGGMLAYGLAIFVLAIDIELFFNITTFFLIYYGIVEIIFCLQLFILKTRIPLYVIVARMIVGLAISLGAVFILAASEVDFSVAMLAAGLTFLFSGIIQAIFNNTLMRERAIPVEDEGITQVQQS